MSKTKKQHDADLANRDAVARATEFSVYQYRHRAPYRGVMHPTLAAAAHEADEIERAHTARPCLIYAYLNGVAHPVPTDLRAAASAHHKETTHEN